MNIRIMTLTLENFKGVRTATYRFDGLNTLVEGDNGTGKSTIFDAFNWLLFGKDRHGNDQTNFDIKTIDPATLKPIERVDHSVEAVLLVDGHEKKLKRIFRENWVKPKGETEQILKGHTSLFVVDGVDVGTKKAYDEIIAQWVKEDVFRLLSDPLFFIGPSTPWKYRREVLLGLVKGEVDTASIAEKYADLLREMNGADMDTFRKGVGVKKRETKKLLEEMETKIQAYVETIPDAVDVEGKMAEIAELKAKEEGELSELKGQIDDIDRKIIDVNQRQKGLNDHLSSLCSEIYAIRNRQSAMLESVREAFRADVAQKQQGVADVKARMQDVQFGLSGINGRLQAVSGRLMDTISDRVELSESLRKLGERFNAVRASTFEYKGGTTCHACGQELPADTVAEAMKMARDVFEADRKAQAAEIVKKANKIKADIAAAVNAIETLEKEQNELNVQKQQASDELEALSAQMAAAMDVKVRPVEERLEEVRRTADYLQADSEITALQAKIDSAASGGMKPDALLREKDGIYAKVNAIRSRYEALRKPMEAELAKEQSRRSTLALIAEAEAKVHELADGLARLERLEFDALAYIKEDVEAQENAINSLFSVARWKMFDYTLEGGIVETCEVMKRDGATYGSMNDAGRIQCGMDVIRVLNWKTDSYAPIFIDNAESITQKDFGTASQTIRLKVSEGKELTISNE